MPIKNKIISYFTVGSFFYQKMLPWLICTLAALFYCYEFFLRVVPSVMTRDLMHAYQVNAVQIGLLTAFYYFAYTPMQLPVGILMDRYGPRKLLSLSVLLCTLGAFLFASLLYFYAAAVGIFLMGLGSAFAFVGVLKLAANWLPPNRFALVAGAATTLGMLGAMGGDLITAIIKYLGSWREVWSLSAVFGGVLTLLFWFLVRDEPKIPKRKRLIKKEYRDWKHMFIELRHIALNPQFLLNGIIGGLMFLPITIFGASWGVVFMEQGRQLSSEIAGTTVSMIFLGMAFGGPIVGWFSDIVKKRKMFLQYGAFFSAIISFVLVGVPNLSPLMLSLLFFLLGVAISPEVLVFAIGHELTDEKAAGTSVAGTNLLVMLGGVVFPPIVGAILDYNWAGEIAKGIHVFAFRDYRLALMVVPFCLLAAFLMTFLLKETYCQQQR